MCDRGGVLTDNVVSRLGLKGSILPVRKALILSNDEGDMKIPYGLTSDARRILND